MKKYFLIFLILTTSLALSSYRWGFYAHRRINRLAVFTIPPELIGFYKKHIVYLTENAINPDQRRYAVEGEAPRHYIDLDIYGDSALQVVPHNWFDAVEKYTEDTLQAYGIVPWHIVLMKYQLTKAFEERDLDRILRYSADIGHYIGDSNVPLHTTENYNGQLTGQYGIHGFWESRLPELYADDYDFFVGKAEYVENVQERAWEAVTAAHLAMDSVLRFEKELSKKFPESKKYSYEERGNSTIRVYSQKYAHAYDQMLDGMVERRMRASIKMVGDIWFTCWVDAGQPDVNALMLLETGEKEKKKMEEEKKKWEKRTVKSRDHN
ncbi:MAG: zinc dependent phospholipase C family protein [Reichenbachiella sp.]|uniref:zinc dependent phospholipase C family protein n=1 Tax=Reichenbachiella sp. TaxID=2184521 RepID=UPI002966D68F|nr:zinc dependent phospholipase C family protein [Reichenbachiella sp.]MDW3211318.1 zinc dependent phospholipase C family protein [Reichenbachiella sp.]